VTAARPLDSNYVLIVNPNNLCISFKLKVLFWKWKFKMKQNICNVKSAVQYVL